MPTLQAFPKIPDGAMMVERVCVENKPDFRPGCRQSLHNCGAKDVEAFEWRLENVERVEVEEGRRRNQAAGGFHLEGTRPWTLKRPWTAVPEPPCVPVEESTWKREKSRCYPAIKGGFVMPLNYCNRVTIDFLEREISVFYQHRNRNCSSVCHLGLLLVECFFWEGI